MFRTHSTRLAVYTKPFIPTLNQVTTPLSLTLHLNQDIIYNYPEPSISTFQPLGPPTFLLINLPRNLGMDINRPTLLLRPTSSPCRPGNPVQNPPNSEIHSLTTRTMMSINSSDRPAEQTPKDIVSRVD